MPGLRGFFTGSGLGFLRSASITSTFRLSRFPDSAFVSSSSASFSEFRPTRLSAACRSRSAPSLGAFFSPPVFAARRSLFGFVLPDFPLAFPAFKSCSVAVILPSFPANAPRTFVPAEKEHVRQSRFGIAPKTSRRIQLVVIQESGLFPLPRAPAPRRWPM